MTLDRPKSTGKRSENNHFLGHCRDIMSQIQMEHAGVMLVAMAVLTVEAEGVDDWPEKDGKPMPWSKAMGRHAEIAIIRAHHFADFYGMWLTEYDAGKVPRRVWYGQEE